MGFLDPKKLEDDAELPGSGVELDRLACPICRREAAPWEDRCPDCDVATVPPEQLEPTAVEAPGLAALAEGLDDEDDASR
ncbi:MAG: hypothetical protein JJT89_17105 [Nitriliruptoraceae bacterium]|nr:hypothetical protein [Nitriliruptoraceae bacterium]